MQNFYIYFFTWLNLIFVAARLWDRIHWSWFWVMSPIIAMTIIGILVVIHNSMKRNRIGAVLPDNLKWVTDFLKQYHEAAKKEKERQTRTMN